MENRLNAVTVLVGAPGTGKTTYAKKIIENMGSSRGVLIFDNNREKAYREYNSMKLERFPYWKKKGVYRLFTGDLDAFLTALYDYGRNMSLVLEDSTSYLTGNVDEKVRKLLTERRHRNLDILFTYHSLSRIPPMVYEMCNFLVIGKTNDSVAKLKELSKLPNPAQVLETWQKVKASPDKYYRETVVCNA